MTDDQAIELTSNLSQALDENERLREEVEQLRNGGPDERMLRPKRNPLCRGCFSWRLVVATLMFGPFFGVVAARVFHDNYRDLVTNVAIYFTGDPPDRLPIFAAIFFTAASLPALCVFADWKWRLYRDGRPGIIRGAVEMWRSFRKGAGRV